MPIQLCDGVAERQRTRKAVGTKLLHCYIAGHHSRKLPMPTKMFSYEFATLPISLLTPSNHDRPRETRVHKPNSSHAWMCQRIFFSNRDVYPYSERPTITLKWVRQLPFFQRSLRKPFPTASNCAEQFFVFEPTHNKKNHHSFGGGTTVPFSLYKSSLAAAILL